MTQGYIELAVAKYFQVNGRETVERFRPIAAACILGLAIGWWLLNFEVPAPAAEQPLLGTNYENPLWALLIGAALNLVLWTVLICSSARRLHDADKSGWFALICFIPIVNLAFVLWLCFENGNAGPNRFGQGNNQNG
jgi:uncharacterized membrane protein YhaH (DUF805 family)